VGRRVETATQLAARKLYDFNRLQSVNKQTNMRCVRWGGGVKGGGVGVGQVGVSNGNGPAVWQTSWLITEAGNARVYLWIFAGFHGTGCPCHHPLPTPPAYVSVCLSCRRTIMTAQQWTGGGKRQGPCCREGRRRGCTTPTPTAADVTHSWSFCWVNRLKNLCCLQKQNLPSPSFDSRHLPQAQWNNIIKPGTLSSNIFILNAISDGILLKNIKTTSLIK